MQLAGHQRSLARATPSTQSPMPALRAPVSRMRQDTWRQSTVCECICTPSTSGSGPTNDGSLSSHLRELLRSKQAASGVPAPSPPGEVFLVGTGPGDPGLLTLRAVQLMQHADVVLYDRLVSEEILRLVHPGARMVYVGKEVGYHSASQEEIHEMLLQFASQGAMVVRLKGGDPYVFGRGGEEVQYLAQHGITTHAVPGITAAAGICAELGIPMTHRGVATSVRFLTGHTREGGEAMLDPVIKDSSAPHTTLVVYMGLQTLPALSAQLQAAGMAGTIPCVAVERGTTARQRVVYGMLSDLYGRTQEAGLQSPTLIVVGEVVALAAGWAAWEAAGRPRGEAAPQRCARLAVPSALEVLAGVEAAAGVAAAV